MNLIEKNSLLTELVSGLELPETAYETAKARYEDIGNWLSRKESKTYSNDPHIFPQGSFRLGTAIKPISESEAYDLDLVCKLNTGISKEIHTQEYLKNMVGDEIEIYRQARGIKEKSTPKHRCWRVEYQDSLNFHMDIVPCIPEVEQKRKLIKEALLIVDRTSTIAEAVSDLAVSITDDRHVGYRKICDDWNISNPEGYAIWFESRMRLARQLLLERTALLKAASIDELPYYKWKTPLQSCIQLLKRHRDIMFINDNDVKPISIIITTLSATAYQGEQDIETAMYNILGSMPGLIRKNSPRIPNPVDPGEDFADKWSMEKYRHLKLEQNFNNWLVQAKADFTSLLNSGDPRNLIEFSRQKYRITLNESIINNYFKETATIVAPTINVIKNRPEPWLGI